VQQTYSRPHPEARSHRFEDRPRATDLALDLTAARRWPLWLARLCLLGAVLAVLPLLRGPIGDAEGRESLLMLTLAVSVTWVVFLTWAYETITKEGKEPRTRVMKAALTFGASCVAVGQFMIGAQADPVHARTKVTPADRSLPALLDSASGLAIHHDHVGLLPRFSAKMTGATQAPVSLIFLGNGCELLEAFAAGGWHAAERITPRTALRAFGRGVLNRPYHCAPVFPSFLEGKLHDVAFQQTNPGGSSRRRHHARWWLTDFTCEGKQVWVATASYDAGVGVGRLFPMPIHHIDPNIDGERDYIVRSLAATGRVRVTQEVRMTEPMTGRNAAGDHFYTQGMAFVLA
jgi:hypothetical protein